MVSYLIPSRKFQNAVPALGVMPPTLGVGEFINNIELHEAPTHRHSYYKSIMFADIMRMGVWIQWGQDWSSGME